MNDSKYTLWQALACNAKIQDRRLFAINDVVDSATFCSEEEREMARENLMAAYATQAARVSESIPGLMTRVDARMEDSEPVTRSAARGAGHVESRFAERSAAFLAKQDRVYEQRDLCLEGVCAHNYQDDTHCPCGCCCEPDRSTYRFGDDGLAAFSGHREVIKNLLLAGWKGFNSVAETEEEQAALEAEGVFCFACLHRSGKAFILRLSLTDKPRTYGLGELATDSLRGLPIAAVKSWGELSFWMDEHGFTRGGPCWAQDPPVCTV